LKFSVLSSKKIGIHRIPRHWGLKKGIGHQSIGNFIQMKKKLTLRGQQSENNPQSPKTEFVFQNQYDRVIHSSMGKNILLGVQKAKISFKSPKAEFGAKNQYGRVIYLSIDREFYME
jgi:hypothetical protein